MSQIKADIRNKTLAKRDGLSIDVRAAYSDQIAQYFDAFSLQETDILSAFLPIRSEVDLNPLIEIARPKARQICLPFILSKTLIEFRTFSGEDDLVDNGFGTKAPNDDCRKVDPNIMLVPLSVFDKKGNRIGYGAGHYDRAIASLMEKGKTPTLIGIAFSCQEIDEVPAEPHDVPLDMILTENGLRSF